MIDSTRTLNDDLHFLLRDKYNLTELEILDMIKNVDKAPKEIKEDIEQLKNGYPLDYLIGYSEFLGLHIDLYKKPLIPRPETEYWASKIVNTLNRESNLSVLDIFCGSGCVGLAILSKFPNSACTFADISSEYLAQTKHNADINNIDTSRYQLIQSDVFTKITGRYDLITANPPYVSKFEQYDKGIKYEPAKAIFAEEDGLELIRGFLAGAMDHINSKGKIFMEFGETQKDKIDSFLKGFGYEKWDFHRDQFDKWRWVEIG